MRYLTAKSGKYRSSQAEGVGSNYTGDRDEHALAAAGGVEDETSAKQLTETANISRSDFAIGRSNHKLSAS